MYLHDLAESFFIDIELGFKYNAQRQRKKQILNSQFTIVRQLL